MILIWQGDERRYEESTMIRPGISSKDMPSKTHDAAIHADPDLVGKSTPHKSPGSSKTGLH